MLKRAENRQVIIKGLSRVGCVVAQKNIGNSYVSKINENLGLSSGIVFLKEASAIDTERKRQQLYSNKKENKLRKLQRKFKKRMELNNKEKREGTTYKTAVAMSTHVDDNTIPTFSQPPKLTPINSVENVVYFDIETGSLARDTDILQIAAICDDKTYDQYVLPRKPISPASSRVTGLTASGGVLFLHGSPVSAIPLKEALILFLSWLQCIGRVVLVGHNMKRFDFPRLLMAIRAVNLGEEFMNSCVGGIDSLPIFKEIHPDMENYKQQYLFETLMKEKCSAHNALDDVVSLQKLFEFSNVSEKVMIHHSFSTKWEFQDITFRDITASNVKTMECLRRRKVISTHMINKVASSGLQYKHLCLAFQRDGKNGLIQLLSEKNCGVTRVTSSKKVLDSLSNYFQSEVLESVCISRYP